MQNETIVISVTRNNLNEPLIQQLFEFVNAHSKGMEIKKISAEKDWITGKTRVTIEGETNE